MSCCELFEFSRADLADVECRRLAHRRAFESLASARFETVFPHQANDALSTDALLLLDEILVNARAAMLSFEPTLLT